MKCHYNVNVAHSVICLILAWDKYFCSTRNWAPTFTTSHRHTHINFHFLITVESATSQALFQWILNVTCWFSITSSSIWAAYTPVPDALAQPVQSLSLDQSFIIIIFLLPLIRLCIVWMWKLSYDVCLTIFKLFSIFYQSAKATFGRFQIPQCWS